MTNWKEIYTRGSDEQQDIAKDRDMDVGQSTDGNSIPTYDIDTSCNHTLLTHPIKPSYLHTLLSNIIDTSYQHTLLTNPIDTSYQCIVTILSMHRNHPINPFHDISSYSEPSPYM